MAATTNEKDDTVRLILMDMEKHEGFLVFGRKMREKIPSITTVDIQYYYQKYRGFDRRPPTHSIETGERL